VSLGKSFPSLGSSDHLKNEGILNFIFFTLFLSVVLGMELRALHMLGMCPTAKLHSEPKTKIFD
jgi:hypothetical protein